MGRRKSRGLSFAAESGKRKDAFRKFIHDGEESIFKSRERVFLVPFEKVPERIRSVAKFDRKLENVRQQRRESILLQRNFKPLKGGKCKDLM